jgi:hypothetical protein
MVAHVEPVNLQPYYDIKKNETAWIMWQICKSQGLDYNTAVFFIYIVYESTEESELPHEITNE